MLCLLVVSVCLSVAVCDVTQDVETEAGTVRGFRADDDEYFKFLGIPYAEPPLGDNRFKPPLPKTPWEGVYIANRTVLCPQIGTGDENCLILNIFTPQRVKETPVLVYIHGGSYIIGMGQTSGVEQVMKQNVIVVTLNYRLGALGFLCLRTREAPGNAGLRDQIAALNWVQRNIRKFGGNPDDVTVYGMSAGGASVDLLVLSKATTGLFKRAIIESGVATDVWAVDENPTETAKDFAKKLGFAEDHLDIVGFLTSVPAEKLTLTNYELYQNSTDGTFVFAPCVEDKLIGVDTIISENPHKSLRDKSYNKVPMMFIFSDLEGLFLRSFDYYTLNYRDRMNEEFSDFMSADLIFTSQAQRDELTERVKTFYFGQEPVGENTTINYMDYFGDSLVLHRLLNSAISYAESSPVYLMEFAYKGKLGTIEPFFDNIKRAGHGDGIKHVILLREMESSDRQAVEKMIMLVTNFMRYSNPTPSPTDLLPTLWPPTNPGGVYLRFGHQLEVKDKPHWDKKTFWNSIYEENGKL